MGTYEGLSVPIFGEFYRYSADQTQNLFVEDDGVHNFTVALDAVGGDNAHALNITSSTALTGYDQGYYVNLTASGAGAGGQVHAFAADITISGTPTTSTWYGGMYLYIAGGGTLTNAVVYGIYVDIVEMGSADYNCNLFLSRSNSNKATSVDTFILFNMQGSTPATGSCMYVAGNRYPTYFLELAAATVVSDMYDEDAGDQADAGVGNLKVSINGTVRTIRLFADT